MTGWRDSGIRTGRVLGSIALGTLALGSAVGLAATAAWLIARASQLPSPADLALAAVLVRTLGIGRGLFRYLERLYSHDTALRAMTHLRARVYDRIERGGADRALSLRRGDIVARMGADMDAVGDALVRAAIPLGVAATVSLLAVGIVGAFHAGAGLALLAALALAATLQSALTAKAARAAQRGGAEAEAAVAAAVLDAVEAGAERQVWGEALGTEGDLGRAEEALRASREAVAKPTALAAAGLALAAGAALVAAVAIAVTAVHGNVLSGPHAAIVALTPLAAFEAVGAVGPAVQQLARARAARRRIDDMAGAEGPMPPPAQPQRPAAPSATRASAGLVLEGVSAAWPGGQPTRPLDLRVEPGTALGVIGPSGVGKTTLLLTLAGALPPASGRVLLGGRPVGPADTGTSLAVTPEDSHIFGTTVLENLRAARGDVTAAEAEEALTAVGLGPWLRSQPDGVDTLLGPGGLSVSGGERRRLLLARVLLHPAPVHLVDEPAEHLDRDGSATLAGLLATMRAQGRSVVVVTHDHSLLRHVDQVADLG